MHEQSFNNIVLQLQAQRPSLFNYGTMTFASHPELLCNQTIIKRIDPEVEVGVFDNPVVSEQPLLAIPGYSGPFGLEYCLQLAELSIDFHPSNVHTLPAALAPPLPEQRFSLKGRACAGLNCPSTDLLIKLAPNERAFSPVIDTGTHRQPARDPAGNPPKDAPLVTQTPTRPFPFNREGIICFCLDLFAVLHLEREGSAAAPIISLRLDNLEIVDIEPVRLENAVECFLKTILIMSVLPKVKLALNALILSVGKVLTIGPTPISAAVPFNPAIENDQIKVFVSLTV
ncbi:MAG TPA: hypothetical protein VNO30_16465 [Kofleriaceae bacterium]|nr:hypothetical protein [Kofleriaceae bacterium]